MEYDKKREALEQLDDLAAIFADRQNAADRNQALRKYQERAILRKWAEQARDNGATVAELAQALGLGSRQAVYRLLALTTDGEDK